MISSYSLDRLRGAGPADLSDDLERGNVVAFPASPVAFPPDDDLRFLREELPGLLRGKNVSYHPESDRVLGLAGRAASERAREILREHNRRVRDFLRDAVPFLAENWTAGTSSFRPLEEKGRALSVRASNERLHVDAGAYGATHGDRILRFFMNANPVQDRVWMSKGAFPDLYRRYGKAAGLEDAGSLREGAWDRLRTGLARRFAALGLPAARLLDSSPYDRLMRRFHNFMKESRELNETREGREEFAFKPFSAWMVFTDMVSHACLSGRHAFIDTFVVPLRNCRFPELSPYRVLGGDSLH